MAASILVSAAGPPYPHLFVPGTAAALIAIAFAFRPAEGIGAFLLVSLLAITVETIFDSDLRYLDELGLLFLFFVGAVRHGIPNRRLHLGSAEWGILVVAASGVVSSLLEAVPTGTWFVGLLLLLKGAMFFYLVAWLRLSRSDVERVGVVVAAVAFVILGLGYFELLDPPAFQRALGLPMYEEVRGGVRVIKSIFTHPSLFGWFTVFASLLLYARFLVVRTWWLLPLALALNVGTLLSGRRTPIIGLVVAFGVGLIWQWRHSGGKLMVRTWIPITAVVLLVFIAFSPLWSQIYRETVRDYGNSSAAIGEILDGSPDPEIISSVAQRTALYVASVAIARDHLPFGGGLGRFGSHMSRVEYSPLYERYGLTRIYGLSPASPMALTDTFWPSVLGEAGVIGFAGFATFIAAIFVRLWRASGQAVSPAWRGLALAAILVFVDRFIGSMTAMTYVAAPIAYFTFGTIGAALAVASTEFADRGQAHA